MKDNSRNNTCPQCGGQKRTVSALCYKCRRQSQNYTNNYEVNLELVSPEWLHEFRGLFMGDGYAGIVRNGTSYGAILAVRLRDDDRMVIEDIQQKLSGRFLLSNLSRKNSNHGNQIEWRTTNLKHVAEICRLLLAGALLPAKKLNDIEQVLSFCEWRTAMGHHWVEGGKEEAKGRLEALRASRKYPSC